MIDEILNLHFTDIISVFQLVFDGMTNESKREMFLIFGEREVTEKELEIELDNSYNEGYDKGYDDGLKESYDK